MKFDFTASPTPAFVFDTQRFEKNVNVWKRALHDWAPTSGQMHGDCAPWRIGYSVKTNSRPEVLEQCRRLGLMAEVVSRDEYLLARRAGFAPAEIIYNGPAKSRETFVEAVGGGAIVNLESWRELDWLAAEPTLNASVGIRVNVDLRRVAPGEVKAGDAFSRFGFSYESGELAEVIRRLREMSHVRIAGLHLHRTSRARSRAMYRRLAELAAEIIGHFALAADYVDIGGGFDFARPGAPSAQDYVAAIRDGFERANLPLLPRLVIEPGTALVANAFDYVCEVTDVKRLPDVRIVTTDGTRNDIDPLFKKNDHDRRIVCTGAQSARPMVPLQTVVGSTCLEFDKLFELRDAAELQRGDRIVFKNVGAYTMTLSGRFITYDVPVLCR